MSNTTGYHISLPNHYNQCQHQQMLLKWACSFRACDVSCLKICKNFQTSFRQTSSN